MTLSDYEYAERKKSTRREEFLKAMDEIIPWEAWVEMIRPHYPSGKRGRPVRGIETMLRMYLLQIWFTLSDVGVEDAIYDSYAMRLFMKLNFLNEQVPDSTTLLKFRHLLEEHKIGEQIFEDLKERLDKAGLLMHGGTIVDATIIHAPTSTKKKSSVRSKVEYSFLIVKHGFGYCKVAYKGIAKNMNRFNVLFASANLLLRIRAHRTLTPIAG